MKYYTIFLGDRLWENCIDDMNTDKDYSFGGMLWKTKKKAIECMKDLRDYGFENSSEKFSIKTVVI